MKKSFLVLALAFCLGSSTARASADLAECIDGTGCVRFLWPEDPSSPGGKMVELNATLLESGPRETPLGALPSDRFELLTPDGEVVAVTTRYTTELAPDHSAVIYVTTIKQAIDAPTGDFGRPHFALPALTPPESFKRSLSFVETAFSPPTYRKVASTGPVAAYNDSLDVAILSPLDHFLVSITTPMGGDWLCGIEGLVEEIPEGTVFRSILVHGPGMNDTFSAYGDAIRGWYRHKRIDPYLDVAVAKLGYWTDNGAYYYYKDAPGMNYHQTLIAVAEDARAKDIPYGYFQIDSWWYPKARSNILLNAFRGGSLVWEPIPEMFPDGLDAFTEELGLPLVAHNRWYDEQTPYCERYECVYGHGDKRPALPIEAAFWDEIMDNAVSYGVEVYEQDWLVTQIDLIPWLREDLYNAETWFDTMAEKARERDLTMQLCMASPGFLLEQMKFDHITHVRASGDYLAGAVKNYFWPNFHQTSMFAHATGMWPFKDNFLSSSFQRVVRNEPWPFEEALISNLSAGPVGPADKIGTSDRELLMRTCRRDGVLLKPDRPATPIEIMFLTNLKPWTVTTESKHDVGVTTYLAAFNLWPHKTLDTTVSYDEIGISGDYLVYDWRKQKLGIGTSQVDFGVMALNHGHYYVLAPLLDDNIAVVGEIDKFVTMSAKRFPKVSVEAGTLKMEVHGVPGEEVRVLVFLAQDPVRVEGAPHPESFAGGPEGAKLFTVTVPGSGKTTLVVE